MSEATRAENVAPKPYDLEAHYQELEQKITAAGIPADLGRVRAAFECADRAHSGQKRRDGSPYVSHCIAAAIITAEMGLDEDSIIAALLHDTIEDTSLTHEDIARSFGTSVADIVEGVTKLTRVQYTSVEEQQMENMRKMLLAMAKDIRVILIKMADRLHNMRTMAYQSEEKQRIKSLETMEIYAPIAHRLGMQKIKWELEDLSLLYLDPTGYKAITDALDQRMPTLEKFMGEMRTQIRERLDVCRRCICCCAFRISGALFCLYGCVCCGLNSGCCGLSASCDHCCCHHCCYGKCHCFLFHCVVLLF